MGRNSFKTQAYDVLFEDGSFLVYYTGGGQKSKHVRILIEKQYGKSVSKLWNYHAPIYEKKVPDYPVYNIKCKPTDPEQIRRLEATLIRLAGKDLGNDT